MRVKTAQYLILTVACLLLTVAGVRAAEEGPRILFDQGHGQRFIIEDKGELQLSKLAGILRGRGAQVSSAKMTLNEDVLKSVTALVISGPFESLRPDEIDVVTGFVERGGRLALMLHIGQPLSGLLLRFDLDHSNAVLHERNNVIDASNNFRVNDLSPSPLFDGISQFSLYGAWALDPGKNGVSIARTSTDAWADLDGDKVLSKGDAVGSFSVVVSGVLGAGEFVVFGDDAIFQNRYMDENNTKLAGNLAGWLMGQ